MGPVVYVMAILGCGEAEAPCQQVAVAPARYESVDACNAAAEDVLARQDDILFPVVVAQCGEQGKSVAAGLTPADVRLPAPEKTKVQRARFGEQQPAQG